MPVIPYKPRDLDEPRELVAAIRERRGGQLLNLDRMLLYSPAFAAGWNTFLRSVRTELQVAPKLRELAICAVAVLNEADYEFHHHAPEFLKAGGTERQLEALHSIEKPDVDASMFDASETAVIRLTVEMTRNVQVSEASMASLRAALADDQHVVEIVGVIAVYNMVSRFLVALGIEAE